jgi:hypothetical protein
MPKPKKELVELYLRFRWLLGALKDLPSAELFSTPNTEALLVEIAQAWKRGEPYPMYKLLIRSDLGHINTVRKRIHQLKDAGFVDFEGVEDDARVKLVVPTQKALEYFAAYASLIREVGK